MKLNQFSIPSPEAGAIKLSEQTANLLGITDTADEIRGELKTFGPWRIPISYRALTTSSRWDDTRGYTIALSQTFFGPRTMTNVHQSGYVLEGRVSVNGRKHRAFTSSQLFELPSGRLVNVATIHVCNV